MVDRQLKTKKLREEIVILQTLGHHHKEICQKLARKKRLNPRHIDRVIREMTQEPTIIRKRIVKNQKPYKINSGRCYFCKDKKNNINHHLSYNPEIIVILCKSCHNRIHILLRKNHEVNLKKDSYIKQVHDSLENLNKILFSKKSGLSVPENVEGEIKDVT